ncbi:sugar transferase [Pseudoflavitalea rhizosphaerae]|uniref:sugar transferase n=1 Tax=Pseudoflavitalea rhizosphaerae TaxID=1884793 RepID=UPI000F8F0EB0|nr:sugar transferase [Pseudoflavitalea rhizosphaerae]
MFTYRNTWKRVLDLAVSLPAFLLLLPVLLLLSLWLAIYWKGNPFFIQSRPGRNEKIFRLYKFRTMSNRKNAEGVLLPDEDRLLPLGALMRKYSLDELPQLINVVKGDMSLIGPRPLLIAYLPLYTKEQKRRHEVRPGITGWAQVNGRNAINWDEKFLLDVKYVEQLSAALDWKIFKLTIRKLLHPGGVSHRGHATMPVFKGNNE